MICGECGAVVVLLRRLLVWRGSGAELMSRFENWAVGPDGRYRRDDAAAVNDAALVGRSVAVRFVLERPKRVRLVEKVAFDSAADALESSRSWQAGAIRWRDTLMCATMYLDNATLATVPADSVLLAMAEAQTGEMLLRLGASRNRMGI
jgi:hypothetical protein